jgi:hypothetical protein
LFGRGLALYEERTGQSARPAVAGEEDPVLGPRLLVGDKPTFLTVVPDVEPEQAQLAGKPAEHCVTVEVLMAGTGHSSKNLAESARKIKPCVHIHGRRKVAAGAAAWKEGVD